MRPQPRTRRRRPQHPHHRHLPRAAAEDIAPAVERAGVQTLIFGHSNIPDHASFPPRAVCGGNPHSLPPRSRGGLRGGRGAGEGYVDYINTGAWTNVIAPYSAIEPPTRTYAHVADDAVPHLLQWTDHGPLEPILIRRD